MKVSFVTLAQYALAALAMVALVVLNIWGHPDSALNGALIALISTTVWGGIQREKGIKVGLDAEQTKA